MKKAVPEKKISKTKMDFAKELMGYSVAAGAALTIAHPTGAEIHYEINRNEPVDRYHSYSVDLDGAGVEDFDFDFFKNDEQSTKSGVFVQGQAGNSMLFTSVLHNGFTYYHATRLDADVSIPSSMSSPMDWRRSDVVPNMDWSNQSQNGNFVGEHGYIGVRFNISGNTHYGWIEYEGDADGTSGTILGWAYEDVVGEPIKAGECPPGTTTYYQDSDGDGYGNNDVSLENQSDCAAPDGYVEDNKDCDDNNSDVTSEIKVWYMDSDGDTYGDPDIDNSVQQCTQPAGYVLNNKDCDDDKAHWFPDQYWYQDKDMDGFGDPLSEHNDNPSCEKPTGWWVADNTDCDDENDAVHPVTWYRDEDGDGFGDPSSPSPDLSCVPVAGYIVLDSSDCDDSTYNDTIEECDNTLHQAGGGGSSSDDWYECFIDTIKFK